MQMMEMQAANAQKDRTIEVLTKRLQRFQNENRGLKAHLKAKIDAEEETSAAAAAEGSKGWFGK